MTAIIEDPDDFSDLDAMLAKSMHAREERVEQQKARERQRTGRQTPEQQKADAERIARWEASHEWRNVANVAQFERYTCQCGQVSTIFRQQMLRQEHRHLKNALRWQQSDTTLALLPNEIRIEEYTSPMCPACAGGFGFQIKEIS